MTGLEECVSPFDINVDGLLFVSTILGYLRMSEEQLGFDPTISSLHAMRSGHDYQGQHIGGNARVHNGDVINYGMLQPKAHRRCRDADCYHY